MKIDVDAPDLFDREGPEAGDVIAIVRLARSLASNNLTISVNGDAALVRLDNETLFTATDIAGIPARENPGATNPRHPHRTGQATVAPITPPETGTGFRLRAPARPFSRSPA